MQIIQMLTATAVALLNANKEASAVFEADLKKHNEGAADRGLNNLFKKRAKLAEGDDPTAITRSFCGDPEHVLSDNRRVSLSQAQWDSEIARLQRAAEANQATIEEGVVSPGLLEPQPVFDPEGSDVRGIGTFHAKFVAS